ncbi:MAG: maltokinase N-terminal cap-like domain-containing protein [Thermomicrobiales bacterium]
MVTGTPWRHGQEPSELLAVLRGALISALPGWLETRRWFADKGRGFAGIELEDALVERIGDDWLMLAIAHVRFIDGAAARYVLPLAWTLSPGDAEGVASAPIGQDLGAITDATEMTWFGGWFLDAMGDFFESPDSRWRFAADPAAAGIALARESPATVMRAEQSNTSLRFDDAIIVKLIRRLQPGPNPDEEMLRALAGAGFERVPRYAGAASWRSGDGVTYPIALAQAFVPNLGDGWSRMLHRLEDVAAGTIAHQLASTSPEGLLGRRTGELHVALCQIDEPAFTPESPSPDAITADMRRTHEAIDTAVSLIEEGRARLPHLLRSDLPRTIAALRATVTRAEGFRDEAVTRRIRVHGDFHLGQTLRTPDGDWMLIDFEGEPARPVAERREKTSALKDVAGMLRSFAYARGAAERAAGERAGREVRIRFSRWEAEARVAFLMAYREALGAAPAPLVPADDDAFARALAAWELDKALYEIAYEVRNRPEWLELPLRSLLA